MPYLFFTMHIWGICFCNIIHAAATPRLWCMLAILDCQVIDVFVLQGFSYGNCWWLCWCRTTGRIPSPGPCWCSCCHAVCTHSLPAVLIPSVPCQNGPGTSASSLIMEHSVSTALVCRKCNSKMCTIFVLISFLNVFFFFLFVYLIFNRFGHHLLFLLISR